MPKVSLSHLPLSGLFAVYKPSGPTSMSVIDDIKELIARSRLFVNAEKLKSVGKMKKIGKRSKGIVKIGQGGTLDPLADGVLVVGIGRGTKKLSDFLDCTKEYRTTCLLGCETDSYDSEGAVVRTAPWQHITKADVEEKLSMFRGEIQQAPPIFSALKMDGRPLYEYARKGLPLPRPIEKRKVTVHSLELIEWKGSEHSFSWPQKQMPASDKEALEKTLESVGEAPSVVEEPQDTKATSDKPTAFVLSMKVSGGTYVRSIVHDLAHALGSAGHVVTLTRSRQGRFALEPQEEDGNQQYGCIPWEVFRDAASDPGPTDDEGWTGWERKVIEHLEVVEDKS
ncbi:hypothetical protein EYR40_001027 [Pleurotus pulmonarius]|nr:hypothetical protein EYR38_004270 [Pleurotus pulmonarius]KAF4608680.1 hypothetical protein EYR40_001027 [Pleurotus pulmonarius]